MRPLLLACLSLTLAGGTAAENGSPAMPPQPGREPAFLKQVLGDSGGGTQPWRTFRVPDEGASAVVEVLGVLTREEQRQATFLEFLTWFQADLQRFLKQHGGHFERAPGQTAASEAVERFGGNPVPAPVPLARVGF